MNSSGALHAEHACRIQPCAGAVSITSNTRQLRHWGRVPAAALAPATAFCHPRATGSTVRVARPSRCTMSDD